MPLLIHRRALWICLSIALLIGIIPAFIFTHGNKPIKVHAANTTPMISPSVSSAHVNEKFLVTGQGFAPNSTVSMALDGGISAPFLGNLTCDSNGNCTGMAQLPKYSGPAGTRIAVTGTFFQATFPYNIAWYDPASGSLTTLGTVTTDSYGNLSATVNAPANIVQGHSYRVVILEYNNTNANSATFTAQ